MSDRLMSARQFFYYQADEGRHDLLRGFVVKEPPSGAEHGFVAGKIARRVSNHVERHDLGIVTIADTGYILERDPDTVRCPDFAFVAKERIPPGGIPKKFFEIAPDLAVEVRSPSETARTTREKVDDYLRAGSRMVWVIDPQARTITVWRPQGKPRRLAVGDILEGGDVLPGFRLRVEKVFG